MSKAQTAIAENDTVSDLVVEAVAEADGIDPIELTPPLYEVIDPDALDQLFSPSSADGRLGGRVTFFYNGYEVVVGGDGYVCVEEQEA